MAAPGPRNALTDVAGLLVGSAQDPLARTGVTVVSAPDRAVCAVDVRGGGPGTRETDLVRPGALVDAVDAVVLSGGSVYGLAAADGVAAALGADGRGFALTPQPGVPVSPIVPAAILYDLNNGGDKAWGAAPPYRGLGLAALAAAGDDVALGRVGAGYGARAGAGSGGLGSASAAGADGLTVAALVAANSFGAVRMPGTDAFWAWPWEQNGEFGGARPWDAGAPPPADLDDWGAAKIPGAAPPPPDLGVGPTNTTIAVVATNAVLDPPALQRVAVMAQAGLARAIRPVFAPFDGDVVFALATGTDATPADPLRVARIGALAGDCLARAVARGVWLAEQR